eukprot:scaffold8630_cov115-Isochrysis_galbana.AAC.14
MYVTPEELSVPDSYSGSPTSYSGAENTEELSTPKSHPEELLAGRPNPKFNSYPVPVLQLISYSGMSEELSRNK